jgi:hypothetical protein
MTPDRRMFVYLVEKFGTVEAALEAACSMIVDMMFVTSMGMLRCGKKARDIDSEYGGK